MKNLRWVSVVLFSAVLSACGGGGGGGGSSSGGGGGRLEVATTTLTFIADGPFGATPSPQAISGSVSGVTSGTLYIIITGTGPAIASISNVIINGNSGTATVSVPRPDSLGVGAHTGTIVVRACRDDAFCNSGNLTGSPQTITVNYYVGGIVTSPAQVVHTLTDASLPGAAMQNVTITPAPPQNWLAVSNANWLQVAANGASGGTLNPALVQSVVDGLSNGVYTAQVTVTAMDARQVVIPVSLTVDRTEVAYVTPYVAYAGRSGSVVIRGHKLTDINIQTVLFGDTPAQSFTVVSPTEIRATYPATLPVGRHRVRLMSNFAGVKQFAELVVVNAPSFTAGVLPYPDSIARMPFAIVYDAERAALGVSIWHQYTGDTGLVHVRSTNNVWQPSTYKSITNHFGLAMSADGTEWIAGFYRSIMHLNANDLSTTAEVVSPIDGNSQLIVEDLTLSNDGTIAMFGDVNYNCGSMLMLYNPRTRGFTTPPYNPCRGNLGASGDGSRLLIPNEFPQSGPEDVYSLDTTAGTVTDTGLHVLTGDKPMLDFTGSRIVLNRTQVYSGAYALLGQLLGGAEAVVLSPDGTRAYVYDAPDLLRTYDLTSAPVGGFFPQIGTAIVLAGPPGDDLSVYSKVRMTITPDGSAVFLAGSEAVIVQPTP